MTAFAPLTQDSKQLLLLGNRYRLLDLVGAGGMGSVYRVSAGMVEGNASSCAGWGRPPSVMSAQSRCCLSEVAGGWAGN